ncbi:uncharacterized protein [Procambarus clarkii]|uniref:uncharacterized protein isoform X1 n=1 Tax=Procambarus clarkii TaxID=6728 RepID=UPI0037445F7D
MLEFRKLQREDPSLTSLFLQAETQPNAIPGFFAENKVLYRQYRTRKLKVNDDRANIKQLVVSYSLRSDILRLVRGSHSHYGFNKTYKALKQDYYWPGIKKPSVFHPGDRNTIAPPRDGIMNYSYSHQRGATQHPARRATQRIIQSTRLQLQPHLGLQHSSVLPSGSVLQTSLNPASCEHHVSQSPSVPTASPVLQSALATLGLASEEQSHPLLGSPFSSIHLAGSILQQIHTSQSSAVLPQHLQAPSSPASVADPIHQPTSASLGPVPAKLQHHHQLHQRLQQRLRRRTFKSPRGGLIHSYYSPLCCSRIGNRSRLRGRAVAVKSLGRDSAYSIIAYSTHSRLCNKELQPRTTTATTSRRLDNTTSLPVPLLYHGPSPHLAPGSLGGHALPNKQLKSRFIV